jgi:hypothetical protein
MSDSHTNFNANTFTLGAMSGAGLLAGAMVSGLQAVVQANRAACEHWTHDQLKQMFHCSELLRFAKVEEVEELKRENAKLRAVVKSLTVRPVRAPR